MSSIPNSEPPLYQHPHLGPHMDGTRSPSWEPRQSRRCSPANSLCSPTADPTLGWSWVSLNKAAVSLSSGSLMCSGNDVHLTAHPADFWFTLLVLECPTGTSGGVETGLRNRGTPPCGRGIPGGMGRWESPGSCHRTSRAMHVCPVWRGRHGGQVPPGLAAPTAGGPVQGQHRGFRRHHCSGSCKCQMLTHLPQLFHRPVCFNLWLPRAIASKGC